MIQQKIKNNIQKTIVYDYIHNENQPCVIYLHGLNSSRHSQKGLRTKAFAEENGYSYLSVDYTAHGESEGEPSDFRVGRCLQDVLDVIQAENITAPLYLFGSSLGGWIAYLLAEKLPQQVKGVLTIAAGVDFLQTVWEKIFTPDIRELLKSGVVLGPNEQTKGYCFAYPMFTEAEPYLLLHRPIEYTGSVVLAHGDKDTLVPWENSLKIKDILKSEDVAVEIIKNGDHRLLSYPFEETLQRLINKGETK